jgi:ribonuclease BN (tRNA processing enzyme)
MHTFTIHGTRGSVLVCGKEGCRHGFHTTSMSLQTPEGLLLIDGGSGLPAGLNVKLPDECTPPPITMLFTHFHMDHVCGLPLFRALYNPRASICMMGDPRRSWREALGRIVDRPYWPVSLTEAGAALTFRDVPVDTGAMDIYGARVTWCSVWHPQECLSYRLEIDGRAYVVATDHEHGHPELEPPFRRFCRGADALIYDAQYLPEEYPQRYRWGHSTLTEAAATARESGVSRLILTHHDALRSDDQLDAMEARTRDLFPNTRNAVEGLCVGSAGGPQ